MFYFYSFSIYLYFLLQMSSWTRFWVSLWGKHLRYFSAKYFHGSDRLAVSFFISLRQHKLFFIEYKIYRVNLAESEVSNVLTEIIISGLQFKTDPAKMVKIVGWFVVIGSNPYQPDTFSLTDPVNGQYSFHSFRCLTCDYVADRFIGVHCMTCYSRHVTLSYNIDHVLC